MRFFGIGVLCLAGVVGCAPSAAAPRPSTVRIQGEDAEEPSSEDVSDAIHDCAATVTEWDVHRCVRRLSSSEQRARPFSNRLRFRDGRLVRHERINGHGKLLNDRDRCAAWDYEYERGHVRRVICTDRNGTLQGKSEVSADRRDYLWQDAWGRPRPKPDTQAVGLRRRHDADGRVIEHTYIDRDGEPTPDTDGVYTVRAPRNEQGALTEVRYFDAAGNEL